MKRRNYWILLSFAFAVGMAGTVAAATALGADDAEETTPAVHRPSRGSDLPTVEC